MDKQKKYWGIMKIRNYMNNQRGAIFVLTALFLPVFLAFLGFAYDVGNLYIHKTKLQNVADAAALAGGRAFLLSQEKAEGPKDTVDRFPGRDGEPDRKEEDEQQYVVGVKKTPSGNHMDADAAANWYIIKNIVNLDMNKPVKSDKYSHLALNSAGANPKTFYRIGLYEYVPLYFLPIILDRKEQLVRAGAIAMLDQGIIAGQTLFDKLFTLENGINLNRNVVSPQGEDAMHKKPNSPNDPINPGENGAKIVTTFDGEIIFASDAWDTVKASAIVQDNQTGGYVYTSAEQAYQLAHNLSIYDLNHIPNMGSKSTWDNSIKIDSYVESFHKKLTRPHIDLLKNCNSDKQDFKTSDLSSYHNNSTKHYTVTSSKGTVIYYHKNGEKIYPCVGAYEKLTGNTYYSFQKDGNFDDGSARKYVIDEKGNFIYCNKSGDNWSFQKGYTNIVANQISDTPDGTTYSYNDENGTSVYFTIEKVDIDFSQGIQVNEREYENFSVYHWERNGNQPATLQVNGGLDGSESDPIYIILTGGSPIKIEVTASNQRPIIFCNLTSTEINEFKIYKGVTFKGTIYSPYSVVNNVHANQGSGTGGGSFVGNIIAKSLNVQDPGTSWTQKNFVADDSDLNVVTEEQAKAQQTRKQLAIQYAKALLGNYSNLNIDDAAWENPAWFANQGDKKSDIQAAWYDVRQSMWATYGLDMPDWPWAEGGKTTDLDRPHYITDDSGSKDTRLRLINFRTEYISEPYIDPFTELFLVDE